MQYTKYIAPPKLKSDFLLGGLTLTELLIGLGLLFLFFSVSVKMAFIVVGIWVVFNVRLYEGTLMACMASFVVPCATSTHTACCTEPALSPRPFVNLRHKVWHSC